jgi:hypothetical protein
VHLALADGPWAFAAEVLRLLRDAAARRSMEEAGLRLVRERFDWSAVAGVFETAIRSAVHAHAGRAAAAVRAPAAVPAPATFGAADAGDARRATRRRVPS